MILLLRNSGPTDEDLGATSLSAQEIQAKREMNWDTNLKSFFRRHTHTREFTRIFGSSPRCCPTLKNSSFFHHSELRCTFPKPHILRDKSKLDLLTSLTLLAWDNILSVQQQRPHPSGCRSNGSQATPRIKQVFSSLSVLGNHQMKQKRAKQIRNNRREKE